MAGPTADRITEWEGGSLSELVTALQSAAMPVRIEVIAPGATNSTAGEVHLLAGGLADAFAGSLRRDDAMAALQRLEGARFLVECRLPDPESGSLSEAGPSAGSLKERPVAALMRYCEDYVLTCRLEVSRGGERAVIGYRRGEIISTTVGGAEASELLPEVLAWTEGSYEIVLPEPVLPHVPGRTREAAISRPSERRRHSTLPMMTAADGKPASAAKAEDKPAAPTAAPAAKPTPVWSPAKATSSTAPAPTSPLPAEPTTRGTPPVPSVPLHPAAGTAAARPATQGKPAAPAAVVRPAASPAASPPAAPPRPAPAPAPAKPAPGTPASPAAAKPTPPLAAPSTILAGKSAPPLAASSALPAKPAAPPTPAKAAPAATATGKPAQPARPSPPAQAAPPPVSVAPAAPAPAASAPPAASPQAAARKVAATAPSNDLLPASGTIEAKPKHATNLPPSTDPIQVAEQPGQVIVTTPAQPPAPIPAASRPSEQRRQRVAARAKGAQHTVRAYVFVGLAIGIGIVLAYWAYWYLPFGHQ